MGSGERAGKQFLLLSAALFVFSFARVDDFAALR